MKHRKIYLKKIDSTNNYALKNFNKINDKTIIYADEQTSGKGRNNRIWISSEKSNLYFTILLKPDLEKLTILPNITQYMAIVLCRVFEKYGTAAHIKWPNDILVDGKKIAGILCETVFRGSDLEGIALGVGVNLNMSEDFLKKIDRPATALNILLGHKINRKKIFEDVLKIFFKEYDIFLDKGFLNIRDEYIQKSMFLNKKIKVVVFDKVFDGLAKDIDETGQLILLTPDNKEKIVNIGDVIC